MNCEISSASAPGKFILLGEHAVVYGKPAVALAIDKRIQSTVGSSDINRLNGTALAPDTNRHLDYIMSKYGVTNVCIDVFSDVPSGSGLGSSAAISSSFSAAIRDYLGLEFDKVAIARDAFEAELYSQGNASPMDTSCSTFGGGVALNCPSADEKLWTAERGDKRWDVSSVKVPDMTFVIGLTGIKAATGPLVAKVKKYKETNAFASDIVDEIETVTSDGIRCMRNNDKEGLGRTMVQDHKLLSILGVSCRELNGLVDSVLPYSYGAKLTGAGGGGSIVALTDRPSDVCEAITLHGGLPFVVKTSPEGVKLLL